MTISRLALAASWCLAVVLSSCKVSSDFNEDVAKQAIESGPVKLEGEQVTFTDAQIQCGLQAEYWDPPVTISDDHSHAALTAKGKNFKFDDDVMIRDPQLACAVCPGTRRLPASGGQHHVDQGW